MHFHKWGKWEDVKLSDELKSDPYGLCLWSRQVITQQRRCSVCNLVQARRA